MIDHAGEKKKIFLNPGEMLLYESAKVPHGRQYPLQGEYFDNIFIHFELKNYDFSEMRANQAATYENCQK